MVAEPVHVLEITLHNELVGYLTGFQDGRNIFSFAKSYVSNIHRPTFTITTHSQFPRAEKIMQEPWVHHQKLAPYFSNLLPEGSLRSLLAQALKVHEEQEFLMLAYLGSDLPGAVVARLVEPSCVDVEQLQTHRQVKPVSMPSRPHLGFSLAGVQMKFSMKETNGRFTLASPHGMGNEEDLGDWIVKTPSTRHLYVPENEYTAMTLAQLAGVDIPEIKLIDLEQLEHLPPIQLPKNKKAFAIKRFDRQEGKRVHMEDFAQVFMRYPHDKYTATNTESIAHILYQYSDRGLDDALQFVRRLLVNILLANGDAHLKNWSMWYPDRITPRLSPAYDIVTTQVYIANEKEMALNLGRNKHWYETSMQHFKRFAKQVGLPWSAVEAELLATLELAKTTWPDALEQLPMYGEHKSILRKHWSNLHADFRLINK